MDTSINVIADGEYLEAQCRKVLRMEYEDYLTFTKKGSVVLFKRVLVQRKVKGESVPTIGPYLEQKSLGITRL